MRQTVPSEPFFAANIIWHGNHKSKLIVLRKSDGQHMGTVETDPFFVTHMVFVNLYYFNLILHTNTNLLNLDIIFQYFLYKVL